MIPRRVTLENFLSFRDRQTLDFEGEPLWVLCGPNGAGKSAVFDAITYALFGTFRGSDRRGNRAEELIHHGVNSFRVEFEFEYDGNVYRIFRTRSRGGRTTQGVARLAEAAAGEYGWVPVPGVNQVIEFNRWVADTLGGLSFEAFTASVLLRQGKAEQVIDSDRDTRLKVLRGIINFEQYVDLHGRVAEAATESGRQVKGLGIRLDKMSVVTADDLAAATQARAEADQSVQEAKRGVRQSQQWLGHARTWEMLQGRRREVEQELAAAGERAVQAEAIERATARLRELREVLPILTELVELRERISTGERAESARRAELEAARARREQLTAAVAQERQKTEQHQQQAGALAVEIGQVEIDGRRLREQFTQAEKAAAQRQELADLRGGLARFPSDLDAQTRQTEQGCQQAQAVAAAFPYLELAARKREEYQRAAAEARQLAAVDAAAADEAARLRVEVAAAQAELDAAEAAHRAAELAKSAAVSLLGQARARRKNFGAVLGADTCSLCGQPITATHAEAERARLDQEVATQQTEVRRCEEGVAAAERQRANGRQRHAELTRGHDAAVRRHDEAKRERERAEQAAKHAADDFARAVAGLAEPWQVPPVDSIGFPTAADLTALRRQHESAAALARALEALRRQQQERDRTADQIRAREEALTVFGNGLDVGTLRTELERQLAKWRELKARRNQEDGARRDAVQTSETLARQLQQAETELERLDKECDRLAWQRDQDCRAQSERRTQLPADWQARADRLTAEERARLSAELRRLEEAAMEAQYQALANDRALQADRERQLRDLTRDMEQLPAEARRPVREVEAQVEAAEQRLAAAERTRNQADRRLDDLTRQHAEREDTVTELRAVECRHQLHSKLADLLGKRGLQRDLVRDAEREIIDLANDILLRVSDGDLRLERPPDSGEADDETVFDLAVRRAASPEPIGVAFLSGSQRFRVAVALALAIGQFASRQARPLEAVIIDEGFGCLDRVGRLAMIQELQKLRELSSPLRRIILVSHQEEFVDHFPVCYRLSTQDGATVAERIRR